MQTVQRIDALRSLIRQFRLASPHAEVGFVPTMGFLHDGHASLIRAARERCGLVVLSVFVNPLQFGPTEDFSRYPRDAERDAAIARAAGADVLFIPEIGEMYPEYPAPIKTKVTVGQITDVLCGASRPGHFDGVATVVAKLFHIVQPDCAFFGLKDAQQVAVIQRMTDDLSLPVRIEACATQREADGLAMSSRNVYLSEEERRQAVVLSQTLRQTEQWLRELPQTADGLQEVRSRIIAAISRAPLARIDYAELLAYPSFIPVGHSEQETVPEQIIVALAVKFGRTRLIDNAIFQLNFTREVGRDHV